MVSYRLRAGRRERPYRMEVAEPTPGVTLVERDRGSSLVTTWIMSPTASATATDLHLSTVWEGGGGIGGSSSAASPHGACAASTASCSTA